MEGYIKQFYADRGTPVKEIVRIGKHRKGLREDAILKASELIYYEKHKWPPPSIVVQIFCRARHLNALYMRWIERPFWKRVMQAIFFPRTLIWDFDKWDM